MVIVLFFFFVLKQQFFWHYCLWMWARANEGKSYSPWSLVQSQGWYWSQHWTIVRNSLRDLKIPFAYLGHFPDPFPHFPPGSWLHSSYGKNNLCSIANTRLAALWGSGIYYSVLFPHTHIGGGTQGVMMNTGGENLGVNERMNWVYLKRTERKKNSKIDANAGLWRN